MKSKKKYNNFDKNLAKTHLPDDVIVKLKAKKKALINNETIKK